MTNVIPPRQAKVEDKSKRFYVQSTTSVKLALEKEAFSRGSDLWTLSGSVLAAWLQAGCPDFGLSSDQSENQNLPSPPSSSSPLADDQGGKA